MIDLEAPFRRATQGDAQALAELVNIAGEGLPLYLWGKMPRPARAPGRSAAAAPCARPAAFPIATPSSPKSPVA
jgi:hypothetical protein